MRTIWTPIIVAAIFACDMPADRVETGQASRGAHGTVSLPGSLFEIDVDANLVFDHAPLAYDWGNVVDDRQQDDPSGSNDNAFGQGTKEDTEVPSVVAGSIPPNKSDLLNFGTYLEVQNGSRFLHMFWHRVQEPSGTTNMDFEFNQSSVLSANGVTPVRSSGDLLIQYNLAQGGSNPILLLSRWIDGTEGKTASDCNSANKLPCWDTQIDLTAAAHATGSINTSAILAADADGLGDISPRTFGEASVNFSAIVGSNQCVSFGSAYLKSRSSDSFTAALKDFITPLDVNISNCGAIKVIKYDDASPPNLLSGAQFQLVVDAPPTGGAPDTNDTTLVGTCTTNASGQCSFTNVLQGDYWLIETVAPTGHDLPLTPYQAVAVTADGEVTKTFINPRQRGAIVVTKLRKHKDSGAGDHPHEGVSFNVGTSTKATGSDGKVCFDNLLFGTYSVTELVPTGYVGEAPKDVTVNAKATCGDTANAATVTFKNMPKSSFTVSFTPAVPGGTAAKITCSGTGLSSSDSTPNDFDDVSETYSDLVPGTYSCIIEVDP